MPALDQILLLAAAIGAGLTAGVCFAFATFLMPSFDRLGAPAAIRTMQSINERILRSSAIVVWFATLPLGVVAAGVAGWPTIAWVAAALYAIGALLVTGRGNVPLNEALDRVDPEAADADAVWRAYRRDWGRWNALRTGLLTIACGGFALAA